MLKSTIYYGKYHRSAIKETDLMVFEGENLMRRRNTKNAFLYASFVAGRIQTSTRPKLRNIQMIVLPCSYERGSFKTASYPVRSKKGVFSIGNGFKYKPLWLAGV